MVREGVRQGAREGDVRAAAARGKTGGWTIAAVAVGVLLGGCRAPLPELEAPAPAAGDRVAFVRDMMIESAEMSEGPSRTEKAVEAVRKWGGKADAEE